MQWFRIIHHMSYHRLCLISRRTVCQVTLCSLLAEMWAIVDVGDFQMELKVHNSKLITTIRRSNRLMDRNREVSLKWWLTKQACNCKRVWIIQMVVKLRSQIMVLHSLETNNPKHEQAMQIENAVMTFLWDRCRNLLKEEPLMDDFSNLNNRRLVWLIRRNSSREKGPSQVLYRHNQQVWIFSKEGMNSNI